VCTSSHYIDLLVQLHAGQFSELAYSTVPLQFVFSHLPELIQPEFPLEGYDALLGSLLVSDFFGSLARLHAYVAYKPSKKQLFLAISGTVTMHQALHDLRAFRRAYPSGKGTIHSGFWDFYQGIKIPAAAGIEQGLNDNDVEELVITGHSMGGAISYLLMLDILSSTMPIPSNVKLKIVVFGAPRLGDLAFVEYWREQVRGHRERYGQSSLEEYSVKGYNDGMYCFLIPFYGCQNEMANLLQVYLPYHPLLLDIGTVRNCRGTSAEDCCSRCPPQSLSMRCLTCTWI
jgi:hypothetical protein